MSAPTRMSPDKRRQRFIIGGAALVVVAALVVGFAIAYPYIRNAARNNDIATATAPPQGIAPPAGKKWTVAYDSSFTENTLDTTKLTPCFDWNYGACTKTFNNGREYYDPGQVTFKAGIASLTATPSSTPKSGCGTQGRCTYKSGLLATSRPNANGTAPYLYKFRYGYVEARMKLPAQQGIFSAFWMLPATPTYKYMSEIDILETLGGINKKTVFQTYHYDKHSKSWNTNKSGRNGLCPMIDYTTAYHRYGVDWQPDHITYYIDGKACGTYTDVSQITSEEMQIIVNVMVDNDWQRSVNGGVPAGTTPTGTLLVDYIRVWQAS